MAILIMLMVLFIGIGVLLNYNSSVKIQSQVEDSSTRLLEHSQNDDLVINHDLTKECLKEFTTSRWKEALVGSPSETISTCQLDPNNFIELDHEFIYNEIIEPIYYKDSVYSLKNTYVIPKNFDSKQYMSSIDPSRSNAFEKSRYYFEKIRRSNLSSEIIEIKPKMDSEHMLTPLYSLYNIMTYSQVKPYEKSSDEYTPVLISNTVLVDYYYLEQGITANGDIIMENHDVTMKFFESDFYSDIGAAVELYTHSKSRTSLISEIKAYDNNKKSTDKLIRIPLKKPQLSLSIDQ